MRKNEYLLKMCDSFGLSKEDSQTLIDIAKKIKIPSGSKEAIERELDADMPFEGGLAFGETLYFLKENVS